MLRILSITAYTVFLLIILLLIVYKYTTRNFDYWKKRNVPGPKPLPFIGNIWDVLRQKHSLGTFFKSLYESSNYPYLGIFIFDEPCLVINSPEIIKDILVKDFSYFINRTMALPTHDDVVANMLFVQQGSQWVNNRARLTPVLSSGKLKAMFPMIRSIGNNLVEYLRTNPQKINIRNTSINYTIDIIAKCFFGVDAGSFVDVNSPFPRAGKAMFEPTIRNGFSQAIYFFKTSLVNLLGLKFFDPAYEKFFIDEFLNTLKQRESMKAQPKDFVSILMDMAKNDPTFDEMKMAGSGLMFFNAGFEPSSTTLTFTLYEMALNPEIQEIARNEILCNLADKDDVTYDDVMELKYLHMCIMETLRKYTPLPFLDRRCEKDYNVHGTDLVIEKGTAIYISPLGVQNDEKHFPEPQKYIPRRFEQNVNAERLIHLPFGYGPRMCVGFRIGLLSVKLALIHVLTNFEVQAVPETPSVVEFEPANFTLQPKGDLYVQFKELPRKYIYR